MKLSPEVAEWAEAYEQKHGHKPAELLIQITEHRPRFDHGNGQDLERVQHDMQRHLKYYHAIHAFDQIDQIPGHRVQG